MMHKPTAGECRLIRDYAKRYANQAVGRIEIGERHNIDDASKPSSINFRLVSDDDDWEDTDLNQTWSWAEFRKGFPLAPGGRAEIDFYVYGRDGDLDTNVQAVWEGDRLVRLEGTASPTVEL